MSESHSSSFFVGEPELPLISVCIPAYNHARFITRCLDSVRDDSYPNKEIVIIDDGSSDSTAESVRQWIAENGVGLSITFKSRANRGVTSTLNELVDLSDGELIAVLASDDLLRENSLLERYRYLEQHPEKMAVFSDCIVVDEDDQLLHQSAIRDLRGGRKERYNSDSGLRKEIIQNWSVTGGCFLARRAVYDSLRYNETLAVEDRDFYLKLVARNQLGFIDKPLIAYRLHGSSTSVRPEYRWLLSRNAVRALIANVREFPPAQRLLFIRPIVLRTAGLIFWTIRHWLRFQQRT